ncbi:helix-turn-helix transcriptional regulator [Nocardiopsis sp. HNM0947]|uniref:Helix-turn-helix transcriptional regulator n=1 Tax=Nocardiopsis coralli TaxID=2772213 RepID=A0ABR9P3E8_9ACTN|nr:helix-turn-helix transcriptional regulator [Nocardiopsis coralli]MBE2998332.1 helix-turn-helix transcriptional regulator [Nocardiopsis coralli]
MRSTDHAATVDHVERFLHTDLRLDRIAAAVGYSPHHLHRSFRGTFGLTLHTYIRRRRLTEAALALATTSEPVLDIAMDHGFGSQQSFTAAFSAVYGAPPATWRRTRRYYPLLLPYRFEAADWELSGTDRFEITGRAAVEELLSLSLSAVDMLPALEADRHAEALARCAETHRAMVAHRGGRPAAALLVDPESGHIDYLAAHPLARGAMVVSALLGEARSLHPRLSVTTFREGDRADLGHRRTLLGMAFRPAPLEVEFGYPTQRLDSHPQPTVR